MYKIRVRWLTYGLHCPVGTEMHLFVFNTGYLFYSRRLKIHPSIHFRLKILLFISMSLHVMQLYMFKLEKAVIFSLCIFSFVELERKPWKGFIYVKVFKL